MTPARSIVFETAFATYNADDIVGEGGAGRVYRATDETGQVLAVKLLNPDRATKDKRKRFKNELLFGQRNQHSNIISVIDSGVYNDGKKKSSPFYVMPYYPNSLRKLLSIGIAKEKALPYFSQLLDGVEAAHLKGVIHRDLKPENVLHDQSADRLLIADFGIARFEEEEMFTAVETSAHDRLANFQYAAPEQRTRGAKVDRTADIYALGLILNEMLTGQIPLGTDYAVITAVAPDYGYLDEIVAAMLRQTPDKRPSSIEEIKQRLISEKTKVFIRQRISQLDQTVIPVTDLDDSLVADPPRVVGVDYVNGKVLLFLSQRVNDNWVRTFHNLGEFTNLLKPQKFAFDIKQVSIVAPEEYAQRYIDQFKLWLKKANDQYEQVVRQERREAEEKNRRQLQLEKEKEERRLALLKTLKF